MNFLSALMYKYFASQLKIWAVLHSILLCDTEQNCPCFDIYFRLYMHPGFGSITGNSPAGPRRFDRGICPILYSFYLFSPLIQVVAFLRRVLPEVSPQVLASLIGLSALYYTAITCFLRLFRFWHY